MSLEVPSSVTSNETKNGNESERLSEKNLPWFIFEIALVFCIFFFFGYSPPPDVNEAHYLTKAKHYWNPSWCESDIFLNSAHAHLAFYWTFGWVTSFLTLAQSAWLGRIIVWALTAFAWQRFSFAIVPKKLFAPLTAGLTLAAIRHFHLAGEWLIGGIEGKGFAYFFLFLAMADLMQERMKRIWIWLGCASAFHVLVGGWSVLMLFPVIFFRSKKKVSIVQMIPFAFGGLAIAMFGLYPALTLESGADQAIVEQANNIYVMKRISHHLVFSLFDPVRIQQHSMLFLAWIVCLLMFGLSWFVSRERSTDRDSLREAEELNLLDILWRLSLFVFGAVVIGGCGIAIDQISIALDRNEIAGKLLRFYWFRMSDVMIPIGVVFTVFGLFCFFAKDSRIGLATLFLIAATGVGYEMYDFQKLRSFDDRPRADQQSRKMVEENRELTNVLHEEWLLACKWIRKNTPEDSCFITPRRQQTFKWHAHRADVANWKDIPQNAKGIVDWWSRYHEIHPEDSLDILAYRDSEIREIAKRYKATHLIVPRNVVGLRYRYAPPKLKRIYPKKISDALFFVYEVR